MYLTLEDTYKYLLTQYYLTRLGERKNEL